MTGVTDFTATRIDGTKTSLDAYRGQVLLIVNTASNCGFTPQYEGLEGLQETLGARGFSVLGFPCNQFGGQEPGDAAAIAGFCETRFGIRFPMFAKVAVNGADTHPLFAWLKAAAPGLLGSKAIKWNFTKFLVDRTGRRVTRYGSIDKPEALRADIEALL